jgi:hypothetical protein
MTRRLAVRVEGSPGSCSSCCLAHAPERVERPRRDVRLYPASKEESGVSLGPGHPVLAHPEVAGTAALPAAEVRQGMLNRDPLTQPGAAGRGALPLAELGQQVLVGVDLDAALPRTGRATLPERAGGTDLGGELDLAAQG